MSDVKTEIRVPDSHFGPQLRAWRVRRGKSLREMANRVHVDYGHLGKVERGARTASRELAQACDEVLSAGGVLRAAWQAQDAVVNYPPAQLPAVVEPFVGRHDEMRHIEERLTAAGGPLVLVVAGPPGAGKTTLVVRCA